MATKTIISDTQGISYVEWSAVLAGATLACAVSLVLLQFGNALGLSIARFQHDDSITSAKLLTVGLWLLWVQLMASMSGGYLAGRMRAPWAQASEHESEMRDGAHGLLVWATSTLVAVSAATLVAFLGVIAAQYSADNTEIQVSADMLRRTGVITGFGLVASSLVSAVAAWAMGVLGGDHRDSNADASRQVSFRRAAAKKKK